MELAGPSALPTPKLSTALEHRALEHRALGTQGPWNTQWKGVGLHLGYFTHSPVCASAALFVRADAHFVEFTSKGQLTDYVDTTNETALEAIGSAGRQDALCDRFSELWEGENVMGIKQLGRDSWESILTVEPGVSGDNKSVYKPYTPPTPKQPSLTGRLSAALGRRAGRIERR